MTASENGEVLKIVVSLCILCESGDTVFAKLDRNKISHLPAVPLFRVFILPYRTCNMQFTHLLSLPESACEDSSYLRRAVWVLVLLRLPARQPRVF